MKKNKFYIDSFYEFSELLTILENLKKTIRWGILPKAGMVREQSSYDHTMELTLISLVVGFSIEEKNSNINPFRLAVMTFLHDLGENKIYPGAPGDIIIREKNENNNHRLGELKVFSTFFDHLGSKKFNILKKLLPLYLSQYGNESGEIERLLNESGIPADWNKNILDNQLEVKVFEFIERVGYIIFIYQEYLKDDKALPLLVQVFKENVEKIYQISKSVKGLEKFFSQRDYEKIINFLESNKDLLDPLEKAKSIIKEDKKKGRAGIDYVKCNAQIGSGDDNKNKENIDYKRNNQTLPKFI